MKHRQLFVIILLLATGNFLLGCGSSTEDKEIEAEGPAKMEAIPFVGAFNPEGGRAAEGITLTEKAARRIGIEMTAIAEIQVGQDVSLKAIPYAAVLYDPNGETWVYTEREPLTYIREPITIDRLDGEIAILSEGPEVQTPVVEIGIAMLYGVEYGVGQ